MYLQFILFKQQFTNKSIRLLISLESTLLVVTFSTTAKVLQSFRTFMVGSKIDHSKKNPLFTFDAIYDFFSSFLLLCESLSLSLFLSSLTSIKNNFFVPFFMLDADLTQARLLHQWSETLYFINPRLTFSRFLLNYFFILNIIGTLFFSTLC